MTRNHEHNEIDKLKFYLDHEHIGLADPLKDADLE